jgi:hypothetical protein
MRPDRPALPLAQLAPYTPAQIAFAVAAWPRAAQELRSALVFRALARAARAIGVPQPWPGRFGAAVHDEMRHARLCVEVGARLGAARPTYDDRPLRVLLARHADPVVRALRLLTVEVAIGETLSTALFRAGRRTATEPLARAVLGAILRDEIRHQRLGWEALAALLPTLTAGQRATAQHVSAQGLAGCERDVAVLAMRWLESGARFDPAWAAMGVLHPEARVEAFYLTVERHVVPRLTGVGLDGPRAWERRYRSGDDSAAP